MRKFVAATLVAVLSVAGLAACGGGDDDGDDGATEQDGSGDGGDSGSDSGDGGSDSGDSGDSSDSGDGDDGSGDSGDGSEDGSGSGDSGDDEFAALLERQSDAVIKVTYDMDGEEMVVAQDHGKRATYSGGGVILTTEDGTAVTCDGVTSEATCTEMPEGFGDISQFSAGLGIFTLVAEQLVQASSQLSGLDASKDEIAGRDAQCVDWDGFLGLAAGGNAEICIDEQTGYLLKFESEGDGSSQSIVATKVEEPDDSDFEPPADVEENPLDNLMNG